MSLLASETQNKVAACRAALHNVETHLEPLFGKSVPEVARKLAPLENAELQVGLAYTVASLYFCHLLTQGVDPSEHPIRQELDRIQLYFKKVRTTAEEVRDKQAESTRQRVDVEAAQRIVQHYTGAVNAAAQRQAVDQSSASSSGVAPHPAQADEDGPPRKRLKVAGQEVEVQGDESSEEEEEATTTTAVTTTSGDAAVAMEGVTEAVPQEPAAQPAPIAVAPAAKPPPPAPPTSPAKPVAKPPPPQATSPAKAKAPIVKTPPPVKALAKTPVAKVPPPPSQAAQLRPLATNIATAAAKTAQGPAADAILARAKADAERAALKKKKKKAQKSLAGAAPAAAAAAATASGSPAPAEQDPYGTATDDPYPSP